MIQEVPYGTYIEMQNDSNNDLNHLPISIVIIPYETHKVIENAVVENRVRRFSFKCQMLIIFTMTLPVTLLLISVIIPRFAL